MDTNRQASSETKDSTRWPKERSAKLTILKTSQALFSKELSEPEFGFWTTVLDDCSVSELRYAFDNWNRNGRYFPKPKDILELVEAYRLSSRQVGHPGCDAICKARHGRGYGTEDIIWLYSRYQSRWKTLNRLLTEDEVNLLLDELDQKRGGAPAWRSQRDA